MARSVWKGPYCSPLLRERIQASKASEQIYTYDRNSTILPEFVGKTLAIHTGNSWYSLVITHHHVGYKLGEWVETKIPAVYKRKKRHGSKN